MGAKRNIAVASTSVIRYSKPSTWVRGYDPEAMDADRIRSYWSSATPREVADYSTQKLVDTLVSSGYFNIMLPQDTDVYLRASDAQAKLKEKGIDAVIIPRIDNLSLDEYVSTDRVEVTDKKNLDKNGKPTKKVKYKYSLNQEARITYTYTVVDVETMSIYAKKTFTDRRSSSSALTYFPIYSPSANSLFYRMIDGFQNSIFVQLIPVRRTASATLMKNSPKAESVKDAYKKVEDGYLSQAYYEFIAEYNESGHLPSGYNAAIMLAALGELYEARDLAKELNQLYASSEVSELYTALSKIIESNELAEAQLNGESSGESYYINSSNLFQQILDGTI